MMLLILYTNTEYITIYGAFVLFCGFDNCIDSIYNYCYMYVKL